jgi:hypothetical protein
LNQVDIQRGAELPAFFYVAYPDVRFAHASLRRLEPMPLYVGPPSAFHQLKRARTNVRGDSGYSIWGYPQLWNNMAKN